MAANDCSECKLWEEKVKILLEEFASRVRNTAEIMNAKDKEISKLREENAELCKLHFKMMHNMIRTHTGQGEEYK